MRRGSPICRKKILEGKELYKKKRTHGGCIAEERNKQGRGSGTVSPRGERLQEGRRGLSKQLKSRAGLGRVGLREGRKVLGEKAMEGLLRDPSLSKK